ncbi:dTMP kinase [Nocardia seriolae]|uniref:dTMP kinase n=1 Tax=Nocardia seriolae TaxID=37332 RepID=UPI0008FF71E5|nr:dTMP kinase [Nocardia seriolae]OJF82499.1 thymidylate kinase [Nocardia seriolae]PSK27978.1 dTMP kinase [Nocardia seriolae]QOW33251.1 dTMP kinase [Nocardia seriolae]QUN21004.1 dTMP kinase [Nocardia seriolae]WNJ60549.1 dTMP kinase [Nocardia seriolae]
MGVLVAVEGLDGAGKRTLTDAVVAGLTDRGLRVATLAFPRYTVSVHADLAAEALRGGHGDTAQSVNAMALLFALDRGYNRDELSKLLADNEIVLLDRYVASNAAYSAARLNQDAHGEIVAWIEELEFERFGLPAPDVQILLDVPVDVAEERARLRGEADSSRALDAYEKDGGLQRRTGNVYRELAEINWHGVWWVHRSGDDPATLVARLAEIVAG